MRGFFSVLVDCNAVSAVMSKNVFFFARNVQNDSAELRVGDEVEFTLVNNGTKLPSVENVRRLKPGTIAAEVGILSFLKIRIGLELVEWLDFLFPLHFFVIMIQVTVAAC
jgi:cold shock CspA family protein